MDFMLRLVENSTCHSTHLKVEFLTEGRSFEEQKYYTNIHLEMWNFCISLAVA